MKLRALALAAAISAVGLTSATVSTSAVAQAKEQFFPVLVYRTGAYAANGNPWANGYVDYLKLVNAKGGINGVKLSFEECETAYATDRGVECYERLKGKGATVFQPLSTGVTFALTEKAPVDKIPLITAGYGRSESQDGSVFTWNFPLLGTYWVGADVAIRWPRQAEGQEDRAGLPRQPVRQGTDPGPSGTRQDAWFRTATAAGGPPGRRAEGDLAADPSVEARQRIALGLGRHEFDRAEGSPSDWQPA